MASKEMRDFKGALESLKTVAEALHVPLDVSELERAARALVRAHPAEDKDDDKKEEPKKEEVKPQTSGSLEQRAPVGVPKDSVK